MIDHVSIGVRDIARAKRFYDAALGPLGYKCLSEDIASLGYGRDRIAFWIGATDSPVLPNEKSNLHVCFAAPTRESVDGCQDCAGSGSAGYEHGAADRGSGAPLATARDQRGRDPQP